MFFGLFLFLLLSPVSVGADIALTVGQYGLPYQWQMRKTSFYNQTQQQLFAGSIAPNTGNALVVSTVDGSALFNYSPAGLAAGVNTDANGYEKRAVWDATLVYQGSTPTPWLAIIMANAAGTAPDSQMYLVNVNNPSQVISFTNFLNNAGSAGLPFKICMLDRANPAVASTDRQVLMVAISGSTSDTTFNSTTSGACFRLYKIDTVGSTLSEFASSKLDASTIGSFSELRDMWWDATLKRMYCAFARTDETKVGVSALYLDEATAASPVVKRLNNAELLTAPVSGAALIPYVHKVRTFTTNPLDSATTQNRYLLINGGRDTASYNKIFALPLLNKSGAMSNAYSASGDATSMLHGLVDVKTNAGTSGSGVTAHDSSWLDQTNDITALTAGLNSSSTITLRTVGCGPLPITPATPVTDIQVVGTTVYVSVADVFGHECLYASSAIMRYTNGTQSLTSIAGQNARLIGWTGWTKVVDTTCNSPVVAFGIQTPSTLVALRDDNTILARTGSTFPTFAAIPTSAFSQIQPGSLDIEDNTTLWRNRRLSVFDSTMRRLYVGTTFPNQGTNSLVLYVGGGALSAPASAGLTSSTRLTDLNDQPIWTLGSYNSLVFVVPHTEIAQTNSFGGKNLYLLSEGSLYAQNTIVDVKDIASTPLASRIINVACGKKGDTVVALAAIPDSTRNDFSSGHNNCVRLFKLNASGTPSLDKDDTFVYDLRSGGAPLAAQSGQTGALTYRALEDMWFDSVFGGAYLAFSKTVDGNGSDNDMGLTFVGWNAAGNASSTTGKLLEGTVADTTGFKHVLKVRTMHTRIDSVTPANTRSYLIFNGTNYAGVASNGTGLVGAKLNRIYALPLVVSGADAGKIATSTTHATTAVLASSTWSETGNSGNDYAKHVVGGGYLPTNARAIVTDMVVAGKTIFVSVANPQGIDGSSGVFASTAMTDSDEKLVGWTSWKKVSGENENIASIGYSAHTDTLVAVNHDSSRVEEISWKSHSLVDVARDGLQSIYSFAKTLEGDFGTNAHGMYNLKNMPMISNDNATTVNLMGAFGYNKVALAYISKKAIGDVGSCRYPNKLDTSRYQFYSADTVLNSIRSLYCLALPQRLPGWVFAGGYRGLAVLCRPSDGRGWTALPASFNDTNGSTQPALSSQSWTQITDVVGPVYKIVTMNLVNPSNSSLAPLVICMGKNKIQAFVATEAKFQASSPAALGLFDTTTIFTDPGEYMRDIAVVGGKMLLVGTTKGLYLLQVADTADSFISPIVPVLYQGANLGPIGSIKVTTPAPATITSGNPTGLNSAWINVDVLTSRVLKNQSEHYQFKINLTSSGSVSSTTTPTIKRAFTRLEGKLYNGGDAVQYELPGKHLSQGGGVDVLANSDGSTVSAFTVISNDAQIGEISDVPVDGARVVTSGGSIYVYKT